MAGRRFRFRSPGVKPGQKIGPLGPFRGRLGLHWVIAPLVLAVVLGVAAFLWLRAPGAEPQPPWVPVDRVDAIPPGSAVRVAGVWATRLPDGTVRAIASETGCPLRYVGGHLEDCHRMRFGLDGSAVAAGDPLDHAPLRIHRGVLYVDPTRRIEGG